MSDPILEVNALSYVRQERIEIEGPLGSGMDGEV
jgi:hypothetical protein